MPLPYDYGCDASSQISGGKFPEIYSDLSGNFSAEIYVFALSFLNTFPAPVDCSAYFCV